MELGDMIARYRKDAGMTIDELSESSGVPKGTLNKIIAGTTKAPTLDTMKAIAKALGKRLADFDDGIQVVKTNNGLSAGALKLASDYDTLDIHGKKTVRVVMDEELERMEDEARFQEETAAPDSGPKVINLFVEPSAAGIAAPTFGRDYEPYELKDSDPQGAAYAVRIQGDSMEPYIKNGSIVFVNHDALADGDIGIFCVDGGTVCKQYHKEGGVIYLLSLNRARSDADVVILPSSNQTLVCQGRVITKKRIPVPDVTL